VLLMLFWDIIGPTLKQHEDRGRAVTSALHRI
jgi:hypothetical protein